MISREHRRNDLSAGDIVVVVLATLTCALFLRFFVIEAYHIPSGSMENTLHAGDMILVNKLSYGFRIPSSVPLVPLSFDPWYVLPFSNVRRGDVIVFELPGVAANSGVVHETAFVKRCVGIPGDTVTIWNSRILVNGREMILPPTVRHPGFRRASTHGPLFPRGSGFTESSYGPLRVPRQGDRIPLDTRAIPAWRRFIEREGHIVDVSGDAVLIDGVAQTFYTVSGNYYFVLGDNIENSSDSRMLGFVHEDDIVGEALLVYWSSAPDDAFSGRTQPFHNVRWSRIGSLIR